MSKLIENYKLVNEGKLAKAEFLRQARQSLPGYINQFTSYEDAIQIFKNKGILVEENEKQFSIGTIEKGIRYELEKANVEDPECPTEEEYQRAKEVVLRNLTKNPIYYWEQVQDKKDVLGEAKINWHKISTEQVAAFPVGTKISFEEELSGVPVHIEKIENNLWKDEDGITFSDEEVADGLVHPDAYDHRIEEAATENSAQLNKAFLELYIKYKDGNYKVKNKETGELEDGKKLAPETAAQKACMVIRKKFNMPRFRPDRDTIRSCSVGRGKLEYQGERGDIPTFNYAWSLKEATTRTQYKDNHDWTVNEYKIAYVLAEFGKQGLELIGRIYGIDNLTNKLLANTIIGTTDAGLKFAVDGMRKVIRNEQSEKWLQSYFKNTKALEAFRELDGKDMNSCQSAISAEKCSEEEANAATQAQEAIDTKRADNDKNTSELTKKIVQKAFDSFKTNRTSIGKSVQDPVKADKLAFLSVCKDLGYEKDSPKRAVLWSFLRDQVNMNRQAVADLDAKFNVNNSTAPKFKAQNLKEAAYAEYSKDPVYVQFYQHYLKKAKEAKDPNAEKTARKQAKTSYLKYKEKHNVQESKQNISEGLLKEAITKSIVRVLSEAATTNLAALSDENASIQGIPAILNSLENVVTEIESFIIKEQTKVQGIFDNLGNIKNEDNIPIGYRFAKPILESFQKDLEPVIAKIDLNAIKVPEAPVEDNVSLEGPGTDPEADMSAEEKATMFSPIKGTTKPGMEEPLAESKQRRGRYTSF